MADTDIMRTESERITADSARGIIAIPCTALLDALVCGDCLEVMPRIPDASVDCVMSDLPYGTTACKWDAVIPFALLWSEWKRLLKPNGAIILTASQPFTSALVMSNPLWFRCEWIWDKVNAANFAIANKQPLKCHESVLVFGEGQTTYNPQKVPGAKNHAQGRSATNTAETRGTINRVADDLSGMKFPKSIQTFAKHSSQCGLHPTQKPTELMRYLIRTYTNAGNVVLDPCCGSGTTCLAAMQEGRHYIGIEINETYCDLAKRRLSQEMLSLCPSNVQDQPHRKSTNQGES